MGRGSARKWQGRMNQMYGQGTDRARLRAPDGSEPELYGPWGAAGRARGGAPVARRAVVLLATGWVIPAVLVLVAGVVGSLLMASAARRTHDG